MPTGNECQKVWTLPAEAEANVNFPPIADLGVYSLAAPPRYSIATGDMMASSVPSTEDSTPYADRRVYPRVPVALPAFLQANGERHAVHLLDLSAGGAKLDCSASLSVGTTVILDCGTLGRAAVVRWQTGGLLGLCFESELDAREVSALLDRSKALDAWMKTRE
jgi:hypothetical protein